VFATLESSLRSAREYAQPFIEKGTSDELDLENQADLEQIQHQFHVYLVELVRQFNLLHSGQELTDAKSQIARFTLNFHPQINQFTDYGFSQCGYVRYLNEHLIRDRVANGNGSSIKISEWAELIERSFELKLRQLIAPALISQ
jgi:hypothetical protein